MSKGKSLSKRIGVKSTFVNNEEIVMTSFGKGNKAILESKFVNGVKENIASNPAYLSELMQEKRTIDVSNMSQELNCSIEEPDASKLDVLGMKPLLETKYFGRTYRDNIHIQIIHQIQDIYKALSIYSNNISYTINSIAASKAEEAENENGERGTDYAGFVIPKGTIPYAKFNENKKEIFKKFIPEKGCGRLAYFPDVFCKKKTDEKGKEKTELREEKDIYTAIRLVTILRNTVSESRDREKKKDEFKIFADPVVTNESVDGPDKMEAYDEMMVLLNEVVSSKLEKINENFIRNNYDLVLIPLMMAFDTNGQDIAFINDYYNFAIRKTGKNIGISIKTLRESLLSRDSFVQYRDKQYDTMRAKIYNILDFIIYKALVENNVLLEKCVHQLRGSDGDEAKALIYAETAASLETKVLPIYIKAIDCLLVRIERKESEENKEKNISLLYRNWNNRSKIAITSGRMNFLSKYIYFISLFLDKKETNDLFTTLINKMENIAGFNEVLVELNDETTPVDDYMIFDDPQKIADELRVLNSISNIKGKDENIPEVMYKDAGILLGLPDSMMDYYSKKDGITSPLRNFISNNVIKSRKFEYITHYCNVADVAKIMKAKPIVRFVLKEFSKIDNQKSDNQIERYYRAVNPNGDGRNMIAYLTDILADIDYSSLGKVTNKTETSSQRILKEKYKALLGLYLSVAYNIIKNLAYINSRYVSAFHSFEADSKLLLQKFNLASRSTDEYPYLYLSSLYCNNTQIGNLDRMIRKDTPDISLIRKLKNRWAANLRNNMTQVQIGNEILTLSNEELNRYCSVFRNKVCHLNIFDNLKYMPLIGTNMNGLFRDDFEIGSYFEIYHFLIQRMLQNDYGLKNNNYCNTEKIFEKYSSYNRNVVKMLCVPFGYNLSRYKLLTIEGLFDKNRVNEQPKDSSD